MAAPVAGAVLLMMQLQIGATADLGRPTLGILSEDPRIEIKPGLLDGSQVDALRRLANRLGWSSIDDESHVANGGDDVCVLNRSLAVPGSDLDGWAAVDMLEDAASSWSKVSALGDVSSAKSDRAPVLTRRESWVPGSHLNRTGLLHLDSRFRVWNSQTVLVYLSGAQTASEAAGPKGVDHGATVFPCVETDDMSAAEAARRERLCSRAFRHIKLAHDKLRELHKEGLELPPDEQYDFLEQHPELLAMPKAEADGSLPFDWQWSAKHDTASMGGPSSSSLLGLAEAMCLGKAPGLRVAPVVGSALLMEGTQEGTRTPDWRLWHTGCGAKGARRTTAQVFVNAVATPRQAGRQRKRSAEL